MLNLQIVSVYKSRVSFDLIKCKYDFIIRLLVKYLFRFCELAIAVIITPHAGN